MRFSVLVLVISCCYHHGIFAFQLREPLAKISSSPIKMNVVAPTGKEYNLNLIRPGNGIFHPNLKYITVHSDPESGRPIHDSWSPSQDEVKSAEEVHVDQENRAVLRVSKDEQRKGAMEGLVDGMRYEEVDGKPVLTELENIGNSDYSNKYQSKSDIQQLECCSKWKSQDYIVEVAIVCDKDWGDRFQHNRQKILDFWAIHYWDLNMRYKTLPSSNISFRITSITVISSINAQPFIEESRNDEGKVDILKVIGKFAGWIWSQKNAYPKFDMAICVSGGKSSSNVAGVAYLNGACRNHTGSLAYFDDGAYHSITVAAHEIGHNLGAPHDTDSNYPGGCSSQGYIMGGNQLNKKFYFSECSDRTIKAYVSSDQAACLKRIDEPSEPVIDPEYGSVLPPTMTEQCKAWLKSPDAVVPVQETKNCSRVLCWVGPYGWHMAPIDNSPCFYGRCFRGRCLPNDMSLLKNVASGQCVSDVNRFSGTDNAGMGACPNVPTPLEKFRSMAGQLGYWLMMPYSSQEGVENGDKCLLVSKQEGGAVTFSRCWEVGRSEWQFENVGNGEYLIREAQTKRCMKQEGMDIKSVSSCDRNNASFRWRFTLTDESLK